MSKQIKKGTTTWKTIYERHCMENSNPAINATHILKTWDKMKQMSDVSSFLAVHRHFGILVFDILGNVVLLHSIKPSEDKKSFLSMIGTDLENSIVEFHLPDGIFRMKNNPDVTGSDEPSDSGKPIDDISIPKRVCSWFLLPPQHVFHLLHGRGKFRTVEFDGALEALQRSKNLEVFGFTGTPGFFLYTDMIRSWFRGITKLGGQNTPNKAYLSKEGRLAFILQWIPDYLQVQEPEHSVDVANPTTAATISPSDPAPDDTTGKRKFLSDEDSNQKRIRRISMSASQSRSAGSRGNPSALGLPDTPEPRQVPKTPLGPDSFIDNCTQATAPTATIVAAPAVCPLDVSAMLLQIQQESFNHTQNVLQLLLAKSRDGESDKISNTNAVWHSMPRTAQLALTRGSTIMICAEPDEPCTTCLQIVTKTKMILATAALKDLVTSAYCHGKYDPRQLNHIAHEGPLWNKFNEPEKLTVFAVHTDINAFRHLHKVDTMAAIKLSYGNTMDKEDIEVLWHKELTFPSDVSTFLIMLQTYAKVLSILFGESSVIHSTVLDFYNYAERKRSHLHAAMSTQPQWLTRCLYVVDMAVQTLLRQLSDPNLDPESAKKHFTNLRTRMQGLQQSISHSDRILTFLPESFNARL